MENSFQIPIGRHGAAHVLHVHPMEDGEQKWFHVQIETPGVLNQFPSVNVTDNNGVLSCDDALLEELDPGFSASIAKIISEWLEKKAGNNPQKAE